MVDRRQVELSIWVDNAHLLDKNLEGLRSVFERSDLNLLERNSIADTIGLVKGLIASNERSEP